MHSFKDSTLRWVALSTGIFSLILMVAGLVLMVMDRNAQLRPDLRTWTIEDVPQAISNLAVPLIGMLLAVRRPRNPIGWLFLVAGVALALTIPAEQYAIHALRVDRGSLPGPLFAAWIANWLWPIPTAMLIFLLLLFPDGHLRSPRWRWAAWTSAICVGVLILSILVLATVNWRHPFLVSLDTLSGAVTVAWRTTFFIALLVYPALIVVAFVSVVMRFRSSSGDERLQMKWFVAAAGFIAVGFALAIPGFVSNAVLSVGSTIGLLFMYAAIAIAVLKYRLYEIDIIINKAVVYGILAAFITVVYVLVVVVVGTVVGTTQFLALVATAIVAIAFQPMRERATQTANRLVYGQRATPYEVLSGFSENVGEAFGGEEILPRMARLLAEGTGASLATVWLRVGDTMRPAASWPADGKVALSMRIVDGRLPAFDDYDRSVPVRHEGELLGALTVRMPQDERLSPTEEKLLSDLAAQAGLVMRNFTLIEDLRSSRRRLVAVQDERAKKLERDLHDGAQQQLVALAVKQRLAESLVERDPPRAKGLLAEIQADTKEALENLRDLARGIYPPVLADQGLAAALAAQARKAALPVAIDADGIGRFPEDVEAAVYFCCLEALQNVAKYAHASRATIDVALADGRLRFEVSDDGVGFDPHATTHGTGLQGMADRLDAIGGTLSLRSAPGAGTDVSGSIPVAASPS